MDRSVIHLFSTLAEQTVWHRQDAIGAKQREERTALEFRNTFMGPDRRTTVRFRTESGHLYGKPASARRWELLPPIDAPVAEGVLKEFDRAEVYGIAADKYAFFLEDSREPEWRYLVLENEWRLVAIMVEHLTWPHTSATYDNAEEIAHEFGATDWMRSVRSWLERRWPRPSSPHATADA